MCRELMGLWQHVYGSTRSNGIAYSPNKHK